MPESTNDEKSDWEKKLEEIKQENKRLEENLIKLKEIQAINTFSGKTETNEQKEKERFSDKQIAQSMLQGKLLRNE